MSAHRRLLDMLAGWADFTDKLAKETAWSDDANYPAEAEAVAALYQKAGQEEMSDIAVSLFVAFEVKALVEKGP